MNKIYEALRIGADKALLATSRKAYDLSGGLLGKTRFSRTVDITKVGTDVKIIAEDAESVTIAKTDASGKIVDKGFRILSTTDLHLGDDPVLRKKCIGMLMNHIRATVPDLVVLTGDIMTMPGLPKVPAAEKIDMDSDGNITGLF